MVKQNVSKDEKLEVTLRKFEKSKKGVNDYIELFTVFLHCVKPDNRLPWTHVEEVVEKVLSERLPEKKTLLTKTVIAFGRPIVIACDNKCENAFGASKRPKVHLDPNDIDDYVYLSDGELGIAPIDNGIDEGGDRKPNTDEEKMNKWCYRECERCKGFELNEEIVLDDFSKRVYNIHGRRDDK